VDTAGTLLGAGALAAFVFAIINSESAGFGSAEVISLLCVSAGLLVAFIWRERRAEYPLLDLRFLRMPQFTTSNIVAFCSYFSTFAIFFFTALYLAEVAGASGYRLAVVFLPMTVLMIASSLLAGRWTVRAGPRWSITIGCLLFAAGLFLTDGYLSPHPHYAPLMAALALAGIGIGTTVVPVTSSALSAVPPERSGMAASATNTSREIGALTGVAVLGSLVISRLHSSLTVQLNHLGIPAQFQTLVINAIETGQIPQNTRPRRLRQDRRGGDRRGVHGLPRWAARGAVPGGRPGPGRGSAGVDHPALTPSPRRDREFPGYTERSRQRTTAGVPSAGNDQSSPSR